jgi:hypothetical protein
MFGGCAFSYSQVNNGHIGIYLCFFGVSLQLLTVTIMLAKLSLDLAQTENRVQLLEHMTNIAFCVFFKATGTP